jgi:peptidoglycan/LPS O-acetylase OafA/YrhL
LNDESPPQSHSRRAKGVRVVAAVLLGNFVFFVSYAIVATLITALLERVAPGNSDVWAEAMLLVSTSTATIPGVIAAQRVWPKPWWIASTGVGVGAALLFLAAYASHGAMVPFLGLLLPCILFTPLAYGLLRDRAERPR